MTKKPRKPARLTPARIASNKRNITKRQEAMDAKAKLKGWRGWSELVTAMKAGDVEIPAVPDAVIIKRKTIGE
jgi:hypothetical protein